MITKEEKQRKMLLDLPKEILVDLVIAGDEIEKENKQLKEKICKYSGKCEEYDCSREEYIDMANRNMQLSLKIDKAIEYIENETKKGTIYSVSSQDKLLQILKGENND